MKTAIWLWVLCMLSLTAVYGQGYNDDVYYQGNENSYYDQNYDENANYNNAPTYQTFYDELTTYGTWLNYPGYGYVWMPNQVPVGFTPYLTGGHWIYTDYGWTWISDYAWGWGPYHYGRWFRDDFYGWMWVPGYDWAPAWVIWGEYADYYCWAPIGPGEYISPAYRPNPHYWNFVPHQNINSPNIVHYVVQHDAIVRNGNYAELNTHVSVISHAGTYNQGVFFSGPKAKEVEKYTGQKVERATVVNISKPSGTQINGNQVNIYRPNIQRTNTNQGAPAKVATPQQVQPTNRTETQPTELRNNHVYTPDLQQVNPQQWTPPRQSTPRQEPTYTPRQNYQQTQPEQQRQPDRGFFPSERTAPVQRSQPSFQSPRPSVNPSPAPMQRGGRR